MIKVENFKAYFLNEYPKELIILHFTAGGSARSAIDWWNKPGQHISTPYVIDLDGTVYQTYDPRYWSYHLGVRGPDSENNKHDKRSIGIELVNWGPLVQDPNRTLYYCYPNSFKQIYCTEEQNINGTESKVFHCVKPYKGYSQYAAFPQTQLSALKQLLITLTNQFAIPHKLAPPNERNLFDVPRFKNFSGILAHENFRADKFDMGPAFPWGEFDD